MLIVNSEYPPVGGGASNASANIARKLSALDQEVTVLTTRFNSLPEEDQGGVNIVRAPARRRRVERSGVFEQLTFLFGGCLRASRLMRTWRPDVVLAFFGSPSGVIALYLRMIYGLPYVVSLRGGDVPGFRPYDFAFYHKLIGPLLHVVWRRAASVVANSSGLRFFAQSFDSSVPIQKIPNGVDAANYPGSTRRWEPTHILFVGRLVYQKGIDLLIKALAGIKELIWEVSLVGDGPQRKELQALGERLGIGERVNFIGWQDREILVKRYQQANLFVFPSRHEGMPNAVLEAMASGLPVIASAIAGNEELVSPNETGILVSGEDVDALRGALRELISNPNLRKKMGMAGRKRVQTDYTWDRVAEQYLKLLQSAVESA
ncbi:MAG: glycosyltransferase family 4 protein [Chloroflexi bacterium]|nr:glycosyltransferase family 4 protein [Chloroflexota bacterium]